MPPAIASVVFAVVILGLFWLDRDAKVRTSGALWIPVIWLSIACSRPVSYWLHLGTPIDSADQVLEGSPIDRLVYAALLAVGLIVLFGRTRQVGRLLRANGPILFFFFYCAVSLLWCDYPGVAFKRWTKAIGDLVMVLIVLSDREPQAALGRLISRLAFVLIPVSVLFIKYYPQLGMAYGEWSGAPIYTGVTNNKNTLGAICMCLGLGTLWRLVSMHKDHEAAGRTRRMVAQGLTLGMVCWVFLQVDSKTPMSSFLMASVVLLVANLGPIIRRPVIMHLLIASMLIVSASIVFLGVSPGMLHALGRDPTLTERTELWRHLLNLVRNPLFGTGFESFWLGPRLEQLWRLYPWHPNEAHDGYLEVFLNLGWIGVALLLVIIARGYRTVFGTWRSHVSTGSLMLAYFYIGLVYNFAEAAFLRMQAPAWMFFLFAITNVPGTSKRKIRPTAQNVFEHAGPLRPEQEQPSV